jgi:hypothetical protein
MLLCVQRISWTGYQKCCWCGAVVAQLAGGGEGCFGAKHHCSFVSDGTKKQCMLLLIVLLLVQVLDDWGDYQSSPTAHQFCHQHQQAQHKQ